METNMKKKFLIELDLEITESASGKTSYVKLTHPDLDGELTLYGGSSKMIQVQLDHLSADNPGPTDPISVIMNGIGKIVESTDELKQLLGKK